MSVQPGSTSYAANPADLPRGTLVQLFFDALEDHPKEDSMLFRRGDEWVPISTREIEERVRRIALALPILGLGRGDRIGLLSENRPEWALADYAALCAGVLDVPIYATLPPAQIAFLLRDSRMKIIFDSSEEALAKILEVRDEVTAVTPIIVFEPIESTDPAVSTLAELEEIGTRAEAEGKAEHFRKKAHSAEPDEVTTNLYTSW